jgi:hypothetical protein
MRIAKLLFAGSLSALVTALPAFAKQPDAQKSEERETSASCHAYQKAPDGSWTALPCQESGGGQTQHKPVAKGEEEESR